MGFPSPNQQLHHIPVLHVTALQPSRVGRRLFCYSRQVNTSTVGGIALARMLIPAVPPHALNWEQSGSFLKPDLFFFQMYALRFFTVCGSYFPKSVTTAVAP